MPSSPSLAFTDTNIIVYAFCSDDPVRSPIAQRLLEDLMNTNRLCLSTQVLQETYVTLTRKGSPSTSESYAMEALDRLAKFHLTLIDYRLIREAAKLAAEDALSFWDALIVAAASASGARILYSEDMQHGRHILGVEIRNPFLAESLF